MIWEAMPEKSVWQLPPKVKASAAAQELLLITCNVLVDVVNTDIYLLDIYDKGEQDSIAAKEIKQLKEKNGLI
jgi:hypothetical protein